MKSTIALLSILILITGALGCRVPGQNVEAKTIDNKSPNKVIILGIDDTGSYYLWDQAKNIARQAVAQLNPGDIFHCRRITHASYLDNCFLLKLELPAADSVYRGNPYDRKAKKRHRQNLAQTVARQRDALKKLSAIRPTGSPKTDVYGFLASASDRFSHAPQDYNRILIIASDLQDNVNHAVSLDLKGVKVLVLGFQTSEDPGATQKLKNHWTEKLQKAGATQCVFLSPDETIRKEHFKGA